MIIFSFCFDPKTKEAAVAGNIGIQQALGLLQQLAITEAVNKAKRDNGQDSSQPLPQKPKKRP